MAKARALVLSGYALNCEKETLEAFEAVGIIGDIVHINTLVDTPSLIKKYQILAIPGGFSFGDDTGSGNALSIKIKSKLIDSINEFREFDSLIIGICNGCQTLLHIFPEFHCSLISNSENVDYICDWVNLKVMNNTKSIWMDGLDDINILKTLPVAHAEGKFYMSKKRLQELNDDGLIALSYTEGNNPNGSIGNVAAVCDKSGKMLCIMPHPERAIFTYQLNNWTLIKEKKNRSIFDDSLNYEHGFGYYIFNNASKFFNS